MFVECSSVALAQAGEVSEQQAEAVATAAADAVYLYRDTNDGGNARYDYGNPEGTNEWAMAPWDKDLTFGKNYGVADYATVDPQAHPFFGDSQHPKIGGFSYNWLIDVLLLKRPAAFPDSGQGDGMEPLRQWSLVGRAMLTHDEDGSAAAGLDKAFRELPDVSKKDPQA